jgi:hypothetical protein
VLGYPGSTDILLAMERGEVEGFCGIGWTFLMLRKGLAQGAHALRRDAGRCEERPPHLLRREQEFENLAVV